MNEIYADTFDLAEDALFEHVLEDIEDTYLDAVSEACGNDVVDDFITSR